ncbi:type II toxin-antitoxin system VapC family toxin [Pararhizobium sp.]|uniref:type II toxin-antitoxin system VapC family toxin n=1 Tax=Pararhizobium sp. TaxID=1977563 RepID=UPI00271DE7E3|nr:type II toxin-antitoxin system VapC family toxin [Pararhizobium sp.]MDO9414879.1 type II toxin-antitoxin system VapC family toxin [Pararhizobium sp.]
MLDTHVAIWAVSSPEMLSSSIASIITDPQNEIYVSVASIWEISIKFAMARPSSVPFSGQDAIGYFENAGCRMLSITPQHAAATERLVTLHRDPFDRLLIAQAITEPLVLISKDRNVASYSPSFLTW